MEYTPPHDSHVPLLSGHDAMKAVFGRDPRRNPTAEERAVNDALPHRDQNAMRPGFGGKTAPQP